MFGFHSPPRRSTSALNSSRRGAEEVAVVGERNERHDDVGDADSFPSRRRLLDRALASAFAASAAAAAGAPSVASAKVVAIPSDAVERTTSASSTTTPERDALLRAIAGESSNDVVLRAIDRLVPLSPLKGSDDASSYAAALDGEWKLVWYSTSNFSPLLKLPSPFRPDSYQYFGSAAEKEVGEGRVAQGLVGGILTALGSDSELWLSSGAVSQPGRPSTLEIYPPFRFQVGQTPGSSTPKRTIVDADSDAEFRKANARSTEAQLAPKNEYEQLYLEDYGAGSLRVSVIASGDPVIVGEMFVHQKLR